jgi:chitinase
MRWISDFLRTRPFLTGLLAASTLLPCIGHGQGLVERTFKPRRRPLLVGYFPQWGLYNTPPYTVKELIANGGAQLLDQINYAQGFVTDRQCSVADPNADLGTLYTAENSVSGTVDDPTSNFRGYFHQLKELKARYPHLKILISLEGRASSFAEDARPENRRAFVASCVDRFLRGNFEPGIHEPGIFDGFDIDWESPQEEDAANFQALLEEFRRQMAVVRPGARLSVAVGPAPEMLPGTNFREIARIADQVGVMNYDYTGPWSGRTGFLAPLFAGAPNAPRAGSIARSIARYEAAGVPEKKLLMGLPFYGYSWTAVQKGNNGLFQNGSGVRGDRPWRYIRTLEGQFSLYRDPISHAAWLFDGETFWTSDDPISVSYKSSYAARQHLGGVMIWELSEDSEDAELLHIAHRSLLHPMPARLLGQARVPVKENTAPVASAAENSARDAAR